MFLAVAKKIVEGKEYFSHEYSLRLEQNLIAAHSSFSLMMRVETLIFLAKVATALMEKAPELFTQAPVIEMADVIATKLPH